MIRFEPVQISDRVWMEPLLRAAHTRNADNSFVNIFAWSEAFALQAARLGDRVVTLYRLPDGMYYSCPAGTGDLAPAVEAVRRDAAERGLVPRMTGVDDAHREALEAALPGVFSFTPTRIYDDYVYSAQRLATQAGKKLHGKRNHVNRFLEAWPDWRFEPMTAAHLPACQALCRSWRAENTLPGTDAETPALERCFRYFDRLELEGGVLFAGGEVVAFAMASSLGDDILDVHFEKARGDIPEAYTMVNREFARLALTRHPSLLWLNREDDMGLENLRKAKESWYPDFLVRKMTATWP